MGEMLKLLTTLLLASATWASAALEVADLQEELKRLRDASPSGVIQFSSDSMFKKFGAGRKRPYALYVFLTAKQVLDNPQLKIQVMSREFSLAAKAVKAGPEPDSAFFVEAWYEEAPSIFRAVQAQTVPYIFRIGGHRKLSLESFSLDVADKMTFQTYGQASYPWPAEAILDYFSQGGQLKHAAVDRPNPLKSPWLPFLLGAALSVLLCAAYGLWRLGVVQHPLPWALLCLLVFWFSVSGGMYNIIRGMPMFIRDRDGKIQFFLSSRSSQLGAEGFIMGSGYLLFSATVSMLTYGVPRVRNAPARNILSWAMVVAAAYLLVKLFGVFQAKTNYRITSYLLR